MTQLEKVLYTAKTHTTGGRDGASRSDDGRLDIKLSSPGTAGGGTNPEQLFAAGWSACFIGAMGLAAGQNEGHAAGRSGRRRRSGPGHGRRRLLPAGPPQCQPAGSGARGRPGRWWTPRTRSARTPRRRAATSTSRSIWSEPDLVTDLPTRTHQAGNLDQNSRSWFS